MLSENLMRDNTSHSCLHGISVSSSDARFNLDCIVISIVVIQLCSSNNAILWQFQHMHSS